MPEHKKSPMVRLALYIAIAFLATVQNSIKDLTSEIVSTYQWINWMQLLVGIVLPTLVTIRAFIDQSLADTNR